MPEPRPGVYNAVPDPVGAPEVPTTGLSATDTSSAHKARYDKQLEAWLEAWKQHAADSSKEIEVSVAREDTDAVAETALLKAMHDAYVSTTQSSLDRALTRMNVVTASVGAITTIYTGLLALVYAAEPTKGKALTLVAVMPALFLGLSLFLVSIYAAMFRRQQAALSLLPTGVGGQIVELRLATFMQWCFGGIWARSWALHAGIVSMGFGLATLPFPFIEAPGQLEATIFVVGLLLVVGTAIFSSALSKGKSWASNVVSWASANLPF